MIIASNFLQGKVKLPQETIIRINIAWVKSKSELRKIVRDNKNNVVFLDFPQGRTKPPKPVISLFDSIDIANDNDNVKYFAISNSEDPFFLKSIRKRIRKSIEIVPKIESSFGIEKFSEIIEACNTDTAMLDKEDLFTSIFGDTERFFSLVDLARDKSDKNKVNLLELQGVIFG